MATKRPTVGVDHLTVVPENYGSDDAVDGVDADSTGDTDPSKQ